MNARATVDERLRALAEHLDPDLSYQLRALLAADSHARTCQELMGRAERAEGVLGEIRRQWEPLQRALDGAQAENRELRRRLGLQPWDSVTAPGRPDARSIGQRVRDAQVPVLPAPPPPPAPGFH